MVLKYFRLIQRQNLCQSWSRSFRPALAHFLRRYAQVSGRLWIRAGYFLFPNCDVLQFEAGDFAQVFAFQLSVEDKTGYALLKKL